MLTLRMFRKVLSRRPGAFLKIGLRARQGQGAMSASGSVRSIGGMR
ncbi:hypothetical protein CSC33_1936 [Pseudomonas aeruginosa]|nr:hypothetical protein CSC33_1936 [Pseudomonas aeruginosa]